MISHSHSSPPHAEPEPAAKPAREFAAFVGIDWADEQHAVCVLAAVPQHEQEQLRREVLPHTPEAIAAWASGNEHEQSVMGVIAAAIGAGTGMLLAWDYWRRMVGL